MGLADFAETNGDRLLRIEAISFNVKGDLGSDSKGTLRMLDLTNPGTRKVVRESTSAAEAYQKASQTYK